MNEDRRRRASGNNKLFAIVTMTVLFLDIGNVTAVQAASSSSLSYI